MYCIRIAVVGTKYSIITYIHNMYMQACISILLLDAQLGVRMLGLKLRKVK